MLGQFHNPLMQMIGRQMSGYGYSPMGGQGSYNQPAMNWWQALSQSQNRGSNTPNFYQRPPAYSYMPSPSPYGLMPMLRQPMGFQPTPEALPMRVPQFNNPLYQEMTPQTPEGPTVGTEDRLSQIERQLAQRAAEEERMRRAQEDADQWLQGG